MRAGWPAKRAIGHPRRWLRWPPLLLACLLAGCAVLAPPQAPGVLEGRLSLRVDGQPERSFSAGFALSGDARQGELLLSGPLGAGAARARWSAGQALLASGGQETAYANLDALAQAALGEALPMAALFDWLQGRAWPGAPASARDDGQPGFDQLGWRVDLAQWADGVLQARRQAAPVVTVRLRLERPE